jgi:uncharacterized protein with GYD domain
MPIYVGLYKFTEQGRRDIKTTSDRVELVKGMVEKMGVKVLGQYITMGEYDLVTIAEAPDDEAIARVAALVLARGNVTTTTMRAFTPEEFRKVTSSLP